MSSTLARQAARPLRSARSSVGMASRSATIVRSAGSVGVNSTSNSEAT
jgi:hypothetical protein